MYTCVYIVLYACAVCGCVCVCVHVCVCVCVFVCVCVCVCVCVACGTCPICTFMVSAVTKFTVAFLFYFS